MDQLKEYLKVAIKYRFWIIVGIAAILPIAAYYSGASAMAEATTTKTNAIKGAESGVKPFQNGTFPNQKWTQLTNEKKDILASDVNKSWKKLYDRQAPLLDWPKEVEVDFRIWGDQWPKNVDVSHVRRVINDYVQVYPDYVTRVYESFHPWNSSTGEGIVVTVPKEDLLRPAVFDVRNPPTLSKVHVAQKRLWIQRTMLDVVRVVNEKAGAKDWDTARIKQITALEVASAAAQDQKSAAKAEVLEPPADIVDPTAPAAPAGTSTAAASPAGGRETGMMGMPGKGGGGGGTDPGTVEFIKSPAPDQYFVVPVALGVLIDQDHISDLLVEFENSPMSIQVVDFDWERPSARVQKPVKGEEISFAGFGGMGSREGILGLKGGRGGMGGARGNTIGGESGLNIGNRSPGGAGSQANSKGGTSVRDAALNQIKANEAAKKDGGKSAKKADPRTVQSTFADPFFNIVEVHIYGQARFYRKPPEEAVPASVPGTAPAAPPATPAPAPVAAPPVPPTTPAPPAVPPVATPAPAAPEVKKDGTPKAEEPKKDAPAAEAPKAETPKADEKAQPPKAEPKKDDTPKK